MEITSYRTRLLDNANESLSAGACKHFVDGLKIWATSKELGAGVIVDDSEKYCEREYRQVLVSKRDDSFADQTERTTIEVYEIA